jgi:hypothetical protein
LATKKKGEKRRIVIPRPSGDFVAPGKKEEVQFRACNNVAREEDAFIARGVMDPNGANT